MNLNIPKDDPRLSSPVVQRQIEELKELYDEYNNGGKTYALILQIAALHTKIGQIVPLAHTVDKKHEIKILGEEVRAIEAKRASRKVKPKKKEE